MRICPGIKIAHSLIDPMQKKRDEDHAVQISQSTGVAVIQLYILLTLRHTKVR